MKRFCESAASGSTSVVLSLMNAEKNRHEIGGPQHDSGLRGMAYESVHMWTWKHANGRRAGGH
jgi:hypothetical protein